MINIDIKWLTPYAADIKLHYLVLSLVSVIDYMNIRDI